MIKNIINLDPRDRTKKFTLESKKGVFNCTEFISLEKLEKEYYLKKTGENFNIKRYFLPSFIHKFWMRFQNFKKPDQYFYGEKASNKLIDISNQKNPSVEQKKVQKKIGEVKETIFPNSSYQNPVPLKRENGPVYQKRLEKK